MEGCAHCEENYHMWDIVVNEQNYVPQVGHRVLDLGGWYGHFTFYCASRGAHVRVYEPVQHHFARLGEKLMKEPWRGNVEVHQKAVAARNGTGTIFVAANNRASSFLREGVPTEVPTDTLSEALRGCDQWDCVKVDIEGSEYEVFAKASAEELSKIKYLTLELHSDVLTRYQEAELVANLVIKFPKVDFVPELQHGTWTGRFAKLFCRR